MKKRFVAAAAFVPALLVSRPGLAETSPHDKAMASQLFDDAEKLFAAGRPLDACPKYDESYRLDPQLGTLLHLGECYAKIGKTAAAWVSFKDALELAVQRSDLREKKIRERLKQLEGALPKLVITVSPTAPADLEIRQDGEVVARAVWGSPVPVDPGVHTLSVKAYGKKPWIGNVQIAATATTFEVKIPDLVPEGADAGPARVPPPTPPPTRVEPAPAPAPAQPPPVAAPPPRAAAQPPAPPETPAPPPPPKREEPKSSPGTAQRVLGWTTAAVGAVGLGVGTVFILQRSSKLNDRDAICPSGTGCTQDDQNQINALTDDARTASTIGTVSLIAGGALAVTGLVLVFTAPSGDSKESVAISPAVGPGFRGIAVAGRL